MRYSLALGLFALFIGTEALACTLMKASSAKEADIKVYFTKFLKEDNSGGRYKRCKLVTKQQGDTQRFFVTPFRQDATVVVHRSNWPR